MQAILSATQVSKVVSVGQEQLQILSDISLDVEAGESIAILGASGSGKTTLLSLLAGLDVPSAGQIHLAGVALSEQSEAGRAQLRGQYVGFVFQNFQLLESLTALENVMLPLELKDHPDPDAQARHLLDRVALSERLNHYPGRLSGGEQQRVAIARAFAGGPDILFADEPTGNLDSKTGEHISDLMFELNADFATTLVLVSHDVRLAKRCRRTVLLEQGRLVTATHA